MEAFKKNCMNENTFENWLAGVLGLMGGGIHYTLLQVNITPTPFWVSLSKVFMTACISTFGGLMVKYLFNKIFKNKS